MIRPPSTQAPNHERQNPRSAGLAGAITIRIPRWDRLKPTLLEGLGCSGQSDPLQVKRWG